MLLNKIKLLIVCGKQYLMYVSCERKYNNYAIWRITRKTYRYMTWSSCSNGRRPAVNRPIDSSPRIIRSRDYAQCGLRYDNTHLHYASSLEERTNGNVFIGKMSIHRWCHWETIPRKKIGTHNCDFAIFVNNIIYRNLTKSRTFLLIYL